MSVADDADFLKTTDSAHTPASESLCYLATHVCLPAEYPKESDYTADKDLSLVHTICATVHAYVARVSGTSEPGWVHIARMLENLQASVPLDHLDRNHVASQLSEMRTGDILAFFAQPSNVGTILTKEEAFTLFEPFEVVPNTGAAHDRTEFSASSYPWCTIQISNELMENESFRLKLAGILCRPGVLDFYPYIPTLPRAQHITALLSGTFQGVDYTADFPRIVKRTRDPISKSRSPWKRSSVWLFTKIAIQMSLDRSSLGRASYKAFMLFFVCTIARDPGFSLLSVDLLHSTSSKILRRFKKFGSSIPNWLSELTLDACTGLRKIFDARWMQLCARPNQFRNPSQDELRRDTRLSLEHSRDYIRNALADHPPDPVDTAFHPNHHRRGTLNDFLSANGAFFDEAYDADPEVTLYDVEQSIAQGIDDWLARVTDVNEACTRIEILMDKYMVKHNIPRLRYHCDPGFASIMLLTLLELFVALDKLIVEKIPILADYSPEIPLTSLERLSLRGTTSLHRLSCAYRYISARHSRSHPGLSVLSDKFSEDSFAVRYYDQSPHHQELKARIEKDGMINSDTHQDGPQHPCIQRHAEGTEVPQSPLPALPLYAKVVVFELQCPPCVRIWRSAAARYLLCFCDGRHEYEEEDELLSRRLLFQRYFVAGPPLDVQIHFTYTREPKSPYFPALHYAVQCPKKFINHGISGPEFYEGYYFFVWELWRLESDKCLLPFILRRPQPCWDPPGGSEPERDALGTSHTSNDVLAAQVDRSMTSLSVNDIITFGQLRSGGSLQWLNILHGLRSRTLNIRLEDFYLLLLQAAREVGPLDVNTGIWIWHQDLQEPSFCHALLDELEKLFIEAGVGAIDGMLMRGISLMLMRLLASSPGNNTSKRIIVLLRRVRRKTLDWMQELSYNLVMAPLNYWRRELLLDMAVSCWSTFDADPATLRELFCSAEDVDAALSSVFLIRTFRRERSWNEYLDYERYDRVSISLEEMLVDAILTDVSDRGIDLAVSKMFSRHKPSAYRWERLEHPNSRWLTCKIRGTMDQPSQRVHLDLFDGNLHVNGRSPARMLAAIMKNPVFFHDRSCFVIPSNLPGIDFTVHATKFEQKVHLSVRSDDFVIRAQRNQSKDILELIPTEVMEKDLPRGLIHGHVHWLNLSTKIIEIRPLERPWEESPENWRINCTSEQYHAYKSQKTLVDVRSPTWEMVSKLFKPLGRGLLSDYLVITSDGESTAVLRLSVDLSFYELSFFVNGQGELESRDFKNMVYDENQCVMALPGLQNILVLRQKDCLPEGIIPRRALVPIGTLKKHGIHKFQIVDEQYPPPSAHHCYTYELNTDLGCLVGNGSLESTGYLACLYAMTSCNWPDPLTGKTGAQAALRLFRSGACRSIMKLKALDVSAARDSSGTPEIRRALEELQLRYYWDHNQNSSRPISELLEGRAREFLLAPQVMLSQLLSDRPAPELPPRTTLLRDSHEASSDRISSLSQLFTSLLMNKFSSLLQQEYIALLEKSAQCAREVSQTTYKLPGSDHISMLRGHYMQCRANYFGALASLKQSLGPTSNPYEQVLAQFAQWPAVTGDILLGCLTSTSHIKLRGQWKKCLVSLALLLLDLQRARRLFLLALDSLQDEFSKELENEGCDGWNPDEFPDWLLIQIQGNFLIRRVQAETAMEMMSPKSGENTVMQVNMGEGKSSVVIPIVAAILANSKQLARVVVPKPQTVQMFELLVARLGGLADRPIYHLPFSRSPECEDGKHVASLKLMSIVEQVNKDQPLANPLPRFQTSIYKYITKALARTQLSRDSLVGSMFRSLTSSRLPPKNDVIMNDYDGSPGINSDSAPKWLALQKWIHSHVRDILDESDDILRPQFQLIYTLGHEQHMDGYPERWTITQQILRLVKECADTLSRNHPNCIEYQPGPPGTFPHVRITRSSDISRLLIPMIVEDVMAGRLPSVNVGNISDPGLHRAIRHFISDKDVLRLPDTVKKVEEYAKCSRQSCIWNGLLLLRGLITSDILLFALTQRRWRVDYGLLPRSQYSYHTKTTTMLAVPYRAKDVPAPHTQFGHPDITIILTCLSYYYGGLSEEQLKASFEMLLDEDDPTIEYALWIKSYDGSLLSHPLRTLSEIHLESSEQWDKVIFPMFFRNQATIDFYLSRMVFPKYATEYPLKISASSWDLAEKREKLVTGGQFSSAPPRRPPRLLNEATGFSGTNDGRWLLPMSIAQRDLDHQQGANARVLAYLLQPENDFYVVIDKNGARPTTTQLLQMVAAQKPEIRVLLDVGAQILDLSNYVVAKAWLDIARHISGAIYFDENDELMVLMRNGICHSMLSSPLARRLDHCAVYLDHAHTRGTDIKLPVGSRAAVTLGPKLTKDSLVQGCMRMRKLGRGHSVMFFAPPEVDWSIRDVTGKKDPNVKVTTADIICWTMHETWINIQKQAPYWAQQGMSHQSRHGAWMRFCNNELTSKQLSDVWLQKERKSLEELYAPYDTRKATSTWLALDPMIRQRCNDLGILSLPIAQIEEEQEREVNREKERERQAELPPKAKPARHRLHRDVVAFVKTGVIPRPGSSSAFRPVFTSLEKTSASVIEADVWSPSILATADFCNTIEPGSTRGTTDQYLRPVQWILSCKTRCDQVLVLISPFEADRLLPDIRHGKHVHLHVYAPRTSKRMKPCDDLKLYPIPPLPSDWTPPWGLIDQLNVFAGQLYLRDYNSYLRLCHFLGEPTKDLASGGEVRRNLFKIPGSWEEDEITFAGSPLPSVMALLAIRTRGKPFAHTHMGKILYGQQLTQKDFEEPRLTIPGHTTGAGNNVAVETLSPSPSSIDCDSLGPSGRPLPAKRGLEKVDISDAHPEQPRKRMRSEIDS